MRVAEIPNTATFHAVTVTVTDARARTEHVHELVCLRYTPFHTRPVKVILIRNPGRSQGLDVAFASIPPRGQGPRRRPGRQPCPEGRPAGRPVRVPLPDDYDPPYQLHGNPKQTSRRAIATPRGTATKQRSATPACSSRYATNSSATSSGTSTPDHHQSETHTTPVTTSIGSRLKSRNSRGCGAWLQRLQPRKSS